ncbi:uncharacterized protein LOC113499472 [Trichoplusia ni]|uniref:Uncharacterized protein LOC113499472 n=1 Tax=Trichoplusia ni TaxID=7111 RepID=A0A7E5W559_TRINI|nr:uncharacterized protein LOC113499472 [Trichoplusia ni]XP_026735775.1 uncharacterized protein LOC113499472 [Trichoplusia ni]
MCSEMWFMSIVALLVVDVRTGALQDRDMVPAVCYACSRANGTGCEQAGSWQAVTCPADRPLCATVAIAPDFGSSLGCAAASQTPCTLTNSSSNSFQLTCVCSTHLCNAPYSSELRDELLNYTFTLSNSTNVAFNFFQSTKFKNITEENLYKAITIELNKATTTEQKSTSPLTTVSVPATMNANSIIHIDVELPRAEALKQEPTVPSDDDEDEGEGSGAYEESRVHNHAVSAPAAPSSYLPADENSAALLYKDLLIITLPLYFLV